MLDSNLNLYVDFALWTPNNKRFQEKQKYEGHKFDPVTATWSKTELPGPRTFDDWLECWKVFDVCMDMHDGADEAALIAYPERIRAFVKEYGQKCWFIIYQADVLMRSEHFERIRRIAQLEYENLSQEA